MSRAEGFRFSGFSPFPSFLFSLYLPSIPSIFLCSPFIFFLLMKLLLLVVGRTGEKHLYALIDDYAGRIKHYVPF